MKTNNNVSPIAGYPAWGRDADSNLYAQQHRGSPFPVEVAGAIVADNGQVFWSPVAGDPYFEAAAERVGLRLVTAPSMTRFSGMTLYFKSPAYRAAIASRGYKMLVRVRARLYHEHGLGVDTQLVEQLMLQFKRGVL